MMLGCVGLKPQWILNQGQHSQVNTSDLLKIPDGTYKIKKYFICIRKRRQGNILFRTLFSNFSLWKMWSREYAAIILRSCEKKHLFSKGGKKKKKGFLHGNRGKQFNFFSSVEGIAKHFYVIRDQDHKLYVMRNFYRKASMIGEFMNQLEV